MNAVKESYWDPEGDEAKCCVGHLYIHLNSWTSKKKADTLSIVNLVLILQDFQEKKNHTLR